MDAATGVWDNAVMSVKLIDFQKAQRELKRELDKFRGGKFVTVGIHEDAGELSDGDMTMAQLGATLNFGADINHPGGTDYGYVTEQHEKDKQVRFLKKGTGFKKLGTTEAHVITIPPRPWLIPGVESAVQDINDIIEQSLIKAKGTDETLEAVGAIAAGAVQQYMTDLKEPPNAKSTIKKKGSDNPLIDSGALRASVTHKIVNTKPEEGI